MSHDVPINLSLQSWRDWEAMFRQTLTPQKKQKSNNTELTVHTGVQKPQYNQQSTYPRLRIHIIYNTPRCKSKHSCNIIPIEIKNICHVLSVASQLAAA